METSDTSGNGVSLWIVVAFFHEFIFHHTTLYVLSNTEFSSFCKAHAELNPFKTFISEIIICLLKITTCVAIQYNNNIFVIMYQYCICMYDILMPLDPEILIHIDW